MGTGSTEMAANLRSMTRRGFLAITAASVIVGSLIRILLARDCRCGAQIRSVHEYGQDRRPHCPNCGRDLLEHRFRLKTRSKGWRLGTPAQNSWDPAQVPFPHPLLVQTTSKPLVVMSRIRLQ